jgi:hypothetical protein
MFFVKWVGNHKVSLTEIVKMPYSIFGITVDRIHTLKWLFPRPGSPATGLRRWGGSKSHLSMHSKVYVYSKNALAPEKIESKGTIAAVQEITEDHGKARRGR